ncbi:trypsin-like peptidase domain-containing protein [Virgibacillus sp. W0181]|uniref:S1C family serine protease n=1 Tax=Virgibacillus sp. W0181 TaxID=3391581 RepID=UPI003F47C0DF
MNNNDENKNNMIDEDLYETFDEEELYELVQEERRKALERERERSENKKIKPKFPKWAFWLIAFALFFNVVALLPQTFSIPAIDFLLTSAKLSTQDDIKSYKQSVVVIETDDSKGTGFSISADGTIVTNNHVVEGEDTVTVAFPDDGLFTGEVSETYPSIDLAVVETNGEALPFLELAEKPMYEEDEAIYFIGNPLKFQGIANEGTIISPTMLSSWSEEVYMLDAPVYRGNSGSPVINQAGEVIGVVFATMNDDDVGRVGLFVPIDYLQEYRTEEIQ